MSSWVGGRADWWVHGSLLLGGWWVGGLVGVLIGGLMGRSCLVGWWVGGCDGWWVDGLMGWSVGELVGWWAC